MWFIQTDGANQVIGVTEEFTPELRQTGYVDPVRFSSFEEAEKWAAAAASFSGKPFHAKDGGSCVSPRYDIYLLPQVGDEVSYAFNGDYYPAGKITKISPTMKKIETSEGIVFYGDKTTGRWIRKGGTFSMVRGTISRLNPEF